MPDQAGNNKMSQNVIPAKLSLAPRKRESKVFAITQLNQQEEFI